MALFLSARTWFKLVFETSHQGSDVVICARQWFVGTDCHLFFTTPLGWWQTHFWSSLGCSLVGSCQKSLSRKIFFWFTSFFLTFTKPLTGFEVKIIFNELKAYNRIFRALCFSLYKCFKDTKPYMFVNWKVFNQSVFFFSIGPSTR